MNRDIFISENASERLKSKIIQMRYGLVTVRGEIPYIGSHADLYHCRLGAGSDAPVFSGDPALVGSGYPGDCIYNAACTGRYFIHRSDITDPKLKASAEKLGMIFIDVPQGYTKCSTLVVDENSIVTSDRGIEKKCSAAGLDVLLISQGHVALPGFRYGFIGGASGRIDDTILFEGDASAHPDFEAIKEFIGSKGLEISYDKEMPLTDIGSIV